MSINNFERQVRDFLMSVSKAYSESWTCSEKTCGAEMLDEGVYRGRARCIAGCVEDMLASLLRRVLQDRLSDVVVFVDMPLSYEISVADKIDKDKDICYPDIIVATADQGKMNVRYMVELKVNGGWCRHKLTGVMKKAGKDEKVTTIEDEVKAELAELKKSPCVKGKTPRGFKNNDCVQDDKIEFVFGDNVQYDIVICSSRNVNKDALNAVKDRIALDPTSACRLYVLSDAELDGKHVCSKKGKVVADTDKLCADDVKEWGRRIESVFPLSMK